MEFKDLINRRKEELGLSLSDLATRLNLHGYSVAKSTIGCWATGERNPQLDKKNVRDAIAMAIEMDTNEMLSELGFIIHEDDHTPEGRYAASIIDKIDDEIRRKHAIAILETFIGG
jgi:hypothetical protein